MNEVLSIIDMYSSYNPEVYVNANVNVHVKRNSKISDVLHKCYGCSRILDIEIDRISMYDKYIVYFCYDCK
ncbi:hypothetical protein CCP3SC1AL1_990011 [Gammaproteobacteria bacterium]